MKLLLSLFIIGNVWAKSCQQVRLAEVGWTDIRATTGMASLMLRGLGHKPRVKMLSIAVTFAGMKNKDIDVFLGNWMPSMQEDIKPYLKDKSIKQLGVNLKGTRYTLAVPEYVWQGGVKTFQDIAKHASKFRKKIYGIEPGNDGNRLIEKMIKDDFGGLGKFRLVESSEQAMLGQVRKLTKRKEWVVFLGWAPHPMNRQLKMRYLGGGDQFFGANKGSGQVYTLARKDFENDCPELTQFFKKLKFDLSLENTLMESILDKKMNPEKAAKIYLKQNPEYYQKVLAGLKSFDGRDAVKVMKEYLK